MAFIEFRLHAQGVRQGLSLLGGPTHQLSLPTAGETYNWCKFHRLSSPFSPVPLLFSASLLGSYLNLWGPGINQALKRNEHEDFWGSPSEAFLFDSHPLNTCHFSIYNLQSRPLPHSETTAARTVSWTAFPAREPGPVWGCENGRPGGAYFRSATYVFMQVLLRSSALFTYRYFLK